jgi:hypothetical protein
MDDYSKKILEQIEKNNALIAEAKQTIEQMRAFFKSLGADLDSGRNIFLESKSLSDEGRKQAQEIIAKLEREFEERYQKYRDSVMTLPGEERPNSLVESLAEDQMRYRETVKKPTRKGVKRMRL